MSLVYASFLIFLKFIIKLSLSAFAIIFTVYSKQGLSVSSCIQPMLMRYNCLISLFKINEDFPKAKYHFLILLQLICRFKNCIQKLC